jgi:hypothetical protein
MKFEIGVTMVIYAGIFFMSGISFGKWSNERQIRREQLALNHGRITVSMPANPEDAAVTMRLLAELVESVEKQRRATEAGNKRWK